MSDFSRGQHHAARTMAEPRHAVRLVLALGCALASVLAALVAVTPPANAAEPKAARPNASTQVAQHRRVPVRVRAVRFAAAQAGKPYRYGAEGPAAFDCSGLVTWVFNRKLGRHLPRSSSAQYAASRPIAKRNLRRADLVFFVSGGRVYHVGIYAGRNRIWHAPHSGARVRRDPIWTTSWRAGRVLR
jgi:cell wall-associated NlpC family hydrolase